MLNNHFVWQPLVFFQINFKISIKINISHTPRSFSRHKGFGLVWNMKPHFQFNGPQGHLLLKFFTLKTSLFNWNPIGDTNKQLPKLSGVRKISTLSTTFLYAHFSSYKISKTSLLPHVDILKRNIRLVFVCELNEARGLVDKAQKCQNSADYQQVKLPISTAVMTLFRMKWMLNRSI